MSIEKVTLESAAEQLKLKIRNAFVELLPDEQWKAMVTAELKAFTEPGGNIDQWGHRREPPPSEFSRICKEVFAEHIKSYIKALLSSPEWQGKYGFKGEEVSDAIKAWLTDNSAALIQSTVQAMAQQAASSLISIMRTAP